MTTTQITCTGSTYLINPDAPEEGTDIHHDRPCPAHPDAMVRCEMCDEPLRRSSDGYWVDRYNVSTCAASDPTGEFADPHIPHS